MATMVKERRRDKKKPKERKIAKSDNVNDLSNTVNELTLNEETFINMSQDINENESIATSFTSQTQQYEIETGIITEENIPCVSEHNISLIKTDCIKENDSNLQLGLESKTKTVESSNSIEIEVKLSESNTIVTYRDLNKKIENMNVQNEIQRCNTPQAYLHTNQYELSNESSVVCKNIDHIEENVTPSAPVFEEIATSHYVAQEEKLKMTEHRPKVKSMSLEEAIHIYGGKEIAEVRAMSEKEETFVEAGPISGSEHPLVDLLYTFRCSLTAVERERMQLACGFNEEEKFRSKLWKVQIRTSQVVEKCSCDSYVTLKAKYEQAELLKDKLPVAKMRLEGLLRDVQDSYCHHQHAALLAHFQIEELISETIKGSKNDIREALSLILQALRLSDNAPVALAAALQRWAQALTFALLDARDLRQFLFLLHHLFRQTRSVRWAAQLIRINIGDSKEAAQAIALLELLLTRSRLEAAQECTEEREEAWEELDKHGEGGAVSEGALRERDLLALLGAFPLRDLVARLAMFTHVDVRNALEYEWGDAGGGAGVLRSCCGVRALLATVLRATLAHAQYAQLRATMFALAAHTLHALAALHMHNRLSYKKELEEKIEAELEATFTMGFMLLGVQAPCDLPATLLREDTAKEYCIAFMLNLHEDKAKSIESLSIEIPTSSCEVRIRIVAQAAIDRTTDHELARIVLEFMFQVGIKRKANPCKSGCEKVARGSLALLLAAHPYLHTTALHILADLYQGELLDASSVEALSVQKWKPTCNELQFVLDDWARRCPQLLQQLLLQLDYTPYVGLSLECQLSIGSWLCEWLRQTYPDAPEWAWAALRCLRVHRTCWETSLDAPAPHERPIDSFSTAYALLATSWGHSIPLICEMGVPALCLLASSRPREAVHCFAPVMLVMAHSPESIALTPKFGEVFALLLQAGPSLIARAFGRGGPSGSVLLLTLILAQLERSVRSVPRAAVLSTWLHALWRPTLPASACAILDTALLACREWPQLDQHVTFMLQDESAKEQMCHIVRIGHCAPLLCECFLRIWHSQREARTALWPRLLDALQRQRAANQKPHVDNALKQIGVTMSADELAIYRTAGAALVAPLNHPSHLTLWRMFFHLYLQRPPNLSDSMPPLGPLFFSGIIKSRTLTQIKKRLQETITYHHNEAESLKKAVSTRNSPSQASTSNKVTKSNSMVIEENMLPALSIVDLTGESSASDSNSESGEENSWTKGERRDENEGETSEGTDKEESHLISYHIAAERLVAEYSRWVEEGERVRAAPHHADIARLLPERSLDAAWKRELARNRPPSSPGDEDYPLPAETPPPATRPTATPFRTAVDRILMIKTRSRRRSRRSSIRSSLEDVNIKDTRRLLTLVDSHLKDIEILAREWTSEVERISALDSQLWDHVCALRVTRPIPPVKKSCRNKCAPIMLVIQERESCISIGAERGIKENRASAQISIRRLARPRPHAAKIAATLHAIGRRVESPEVARAVAERTWRCAGAVARCAPAQLALTALLTDLAEKWLCHDGAVCASLLARWCSNSGCSALQQSLCGVLISPRRLHTSEWPRVYTTILRSGLPSHTIFSYLSKFEISKWNQTAAADQRREMLEALLAAAQRWGSTPDTQHNILLELIGVHTSSLLTASELCAHVARCARASAAATLPPEHWPHVARAVDACAAHVTFDELGHALRELGVLWWETRSGLKGRKPAQHVKYAAAIASVLHALSRAFVAAAIALSYAPERVAWNAWSALQESWTPWISPHPAVLPLLPITGEDEAYTPMVMQFVDTIHQVMLDCPGTEEHLLQQTFEWAIQTHMACSNEATSQENCVQMSTLLAELTKLPWAEHQWYHDRCLQTALRACSSPDKELTSWCGAVLRATAAETWLRCVRDEEVVHRLVGLLYLFTTIPLLNDTLEEATRLPWWRLPEQALDQALERFFAEHHNPAQPYHSLPSFRVLLFACELSLPPAAPHPQRYEAQAKRLRAVSLLVRVTCAPTLARHVPAHTDCLLDTITALAPYIEGCENELEELLSRAVIVMCMEPAAAAALPVWERWIRMAPRRLVVASASAAATLTAFEYFATLADCAARAHLAHADSTGWAELRTRWRSCPWSEAGPLAARGRLHAAYGVVLTHTHTHQQLRTALLALLAAKLHFIDNEVIISVWICYACRAARQCGEEGGGVRGGEAGECVSAANTLLARWSDEPRRSLLRVVSMQAAHDTPTAKHRLLCRLARCVLSPSSEPAIKAYEISCNAVLPNCDVITWGRAPHPKRLPRLAIRLFPLAERYFREELDMSPDDTF